MNSNYKTHFNKKKAFTLIELLIVIAIIGILFIVLVSKVDFATDKAKAVGVQTDFRSFQLALEMVSKEKSGFNSLGWNTGDDNANGVRDSVDEGDTNKDGVYQDGETWTGRKKYLETWTNTYSLIRPGTTFETDGYDKDAIFALETAINRHLDPKLHITINAKTGLITMANGAQDPWDTQYHGAYISAEDGMDRGAIVMYSNGANQKFGSKHSIANGVPTVIVPDNNKDGADDYSLVVVYTYTNGFGEVSNLTTGFSNNQDFLIGNNSTNVGENNGGNAGDNGEETPGDDVLQIDGGLYESGTNYSKLLYSWQDLIDNNIINENGFVIRNSTYEHPSDASIQLLAGDLVLPTTITTIPNYAFYGCCNLTNVKLHNNITSIGNYAFADCTSIASITGGDNLETIGEYAFHYCKSLTTFSISNKVTIINRSTFESCSALSDITIPESVTSIGSFAFAYTSIQTIDIPNSVKTIEAYALYRCTQLTSVSLGNSLETLGQFCFTGTNISEAILPESLKSIANYAFWECGALKTVVIESNTSSIGESLFAYCRLDNVTIKSKPTNISSILKNCYEIKNMNFYGVDEWIHTTFDSGSYRNPITNSLRLFDENGQEVKTLSFPNDMTTISPYLLQHSTLQFVTLSSNITSVGHYAFYNSKLLENVNFNDNLISIGNYSFAECQSLKQANIPNAVTSIGRSAFEYCKLLETVTTGNNISVINDSTFMYCESLKSFVLPSNCTKIESNAFHSCYNMSSFEFNNVIETIGSNAFYKCSSLTNLVVPNSVKSIGYGAFMACKNISSIDLGTGVQTIDQFAFWECPVTEIILPESITSLGDSIFSNVYTLTTVYVLSNTPPSVSDKLFYTNNNLRYIYVDASLVDIYKQDPGWSNYASKIMARP